MEIIFYSYPVTILFFCLSRVCEMSSSNSNSITNKDVIKQYKREMKDKEKRKRDEEEGNKDTSTKQAKIDKGLCLYHIDMSPTALKVMLGL
jgi:hypothetical protein